MEVRSATLRLADECTFPAAKPKDPDFTLSKSVRALLYSHSAILHMGDCISSMEGTRSFSFVSIRDAMKEAPLAGGSERYLLPVLEEYEGGACAEDLLVRRTKLPPALPGHCTKLPSGVLAQEKFFLVDESPAEHKPQHLASPWVRLQSAPPSLSSWFSQGAGQQISP
jgi:hypothetical protein